MKLAYDRHKSSQREAVAAQSALNGAAGQDLNLTEIKNLADRFQNAHARLNGIELELHENLGSGDRLVLLRHLEEARMEYSDARFALSTRSAISSKR